MTKDSIYLILYLWQYILNCGTNERDILYKIFSSENNEKLSVIYFKQFRLFYLFSNMINNIIYTRKCSFNSLRMCYDYISS